MYVNWKKSLLWALALIMVLSTTAAMAAKGGVKGKPGGGEQPPEPVLPNVRYEVQYFTVPGETSWIYAVNSFNNLGQAVGSFVTAAEGGERHAFLYNSTGNGAQAVDLNDMEIGGLPSDCIISSAVGINNHGVIVGILSPDDPNLYGRRGFILDLSITPLTLELVPDEMFGDDTYPRRINDNGDIVGWYNNGVAGMYAFNLHLFRAELDVPTDLGFALGSKPELSNPAPGQPAQIAWIDGGVAMRYTLDDPDVTQGSLEVFPDLDLDHVEDINAAGNFCGQYKTYIKKGNTVRTTAYRYNTTINDLLVDDDFGSSISLSAVAINSDGDCVIERSYSREAIHHDTWGVLALDDLITGTGSDLWLGASKDTLRLNDRDPFTDFGQISGRIHDGISWIGFVVTPVAIPEN